ncbi:MAG: hypothetical protein ABJB76_12975 [Candidatus Nitrosocosmicus sp.]
MQYYCRNNYPNIHVKAKLLYFIKLQFYEQKNKNAKINPPDTNNMILVTLFESNNVVIKKTMTIIDKMVSTNRDLKNIS